MSGYAISANKKVCALCRKTGDKLRVCARCKSVHYCSKECQKASWKFHKPICEQAKVREEDFADMQLNNPVFARKIESFAKFIQKWNDAIFTWGLCAANLPASLARDLRYLETHSFYVAVERRQGIPDDTPPKSAYDIIDAGMRSDTEIFAAFKQITIATDLAPMMDDFLMRFKTMPPSAETLRIVIVQPSLCLSNCLCDALHKILPNETPQSMLRWCLPERALVATALANLWYRSCQECMAKGDTNGHLKFIQDVENALGVD